VSELKFPLFIDMTGKKITVIGGGTIAERRIKTLIMFDADVKVISPAISDVIKHLCNECRIEWEKGIYVPGKFKDEFMVLAATDDPNINRDIVAEAKSLGILANNASNQKENDFFFPAVAVNEGISIGICGTGGDHKAVAKTAAEIRRVLIEGE
jgi:siroheme synthase-like protein